MRSFAPAAVPCARLPAAAARRVAAAPLARLVARPSAGGLRLGVRRTAALVLRAADTDASGYESANDDNVQSGKVKGVSRMTVAELQAELTEKGLETGGGKSELVSRVKAARSGAAGAPTAVAAPAADAASAPSAAASPAPASQPDQVAKLLEELALARQATAQAVSRAEKAEAALAAAKGVPAAGLPGTPATLTCACALAFGEHLLVVGSHPAVGAWDVAGAASLVWSPGDLWSCSVSLPAEAQLECKFLIRRPDGALIWQAGENLALTVSPVGRTLAFVGGGSPWGVVVKQAAEP